MRALVQRVDGARVAAGDRVLGAFEGPGLVVLVGVTHSDGPEQARRLAAKVHGLRLFEADRYRPDDRCLPPGGPRELSAADLGLPLLVVSQFTLYGETRKGRRPTWEAAAPREQAEPLVAEVAAALRAAGAPVSTGAFGADMRVSLVNDGPVTLLVEV